MENLCKVNANELVRFAEAQPSLSKTGRTEEGGFDRVCLDKFGGASAKLKYALLCIRHSMFICKKNDDFSSFFEFHHIRCHS